MGFHGSYQACLDSLEQYSPCRLPLQRYPNGLGILHKEEVARHGARANHELEGYDHALNQPTQPQTDTTVKNSSSGVILFLGGVDKPPLVT